MGKSVVALLACLLLVSALSACAGGGETGPNPATERATGTIGEAGGTVAVPSGTLAHFPAGALEDAGLIELTTKPPTVPDDLVEFEPVQQNVTLVIPAATLGQGTEESIYIGIPGGVDTDEDTIALVTLTLDGTGTIPLSANYHPVRENVVEIPVQQLHELFDLYGVEPSTLKFEVQPTIVRRNESEANPQAILPTPIGLWQFSPPATSAWVTDMERVCNSRPPIELDALRQVATNDPPRLTPGRRVMVLVHGWQKFREGEFPPLCGWAEFLEGFSKWHSLLEDDVRDRYDIFTYGYDSGKSITENISAFRQDMTSHFSGAEMVIVGYSMGGMIANGYRLGDTGSNRIELLVTIGSPLRGSRALLCEKLSADGQRCDRVRAFGGLSTYFRNIVGYQGTKDLAWEHGGVEYRATELCDDRNPLLVGPPICLEEQSSEGNPVLAGLNNSLTHSRYSNVYSLYSTTIGMKGAVASLAQLMEDQSGLLSDGVVPTQSACLSTSRLADNNCTYSVITNRIYIQGEDHLTLNRSQRVFDRLRSILLGLTPLPVPPERPEIATVTPNPVPASNQPQDIVIEGLNFGSDTGVRLSNGRTTYDVPKADITRLTDSLRDGVWRNNVRVRFTFGEEEGQWTAVIVNPSAQTTSSAPFAFTVDAAPPDDAPGAFTLAAPVLFCTQSQQPGIRLNWNASSGAQAFEVHRNGALYAELQTLSTTFENTSNVAPGQTYSYFVRAANEAGTTDSNSRSITVPLDACDGTPTTGADLIISGLTVTPITAPAGSNITVSFNVTNLGDTTAGASTTRIRVNTNPNDVTTSDWLLAELTTPAIAGGSAETYSQSLTLPASLLDGTHYIWVIADVFNLANQVDYGNDRANYRITVGDATSQTACTAPDQVIEIPDANLRRVVAQELGIASGPILCQDIQELTQLESALQGIQAIEGLQHAINLASLDLSLNEISDISALANLTNLETLSLSNNEISDISALANLTNLETLYLSNNEISDISVLANLITLGRLEIGYNAINDISAIASVTALHTNLWGLVVDGNGLSDISALANFTNLTWLGVANNAISDISVLSNFTRLIALDLGENEISDISVLANLSNLMDLSVRGNAISDISTLESLTYMRYLSLSDNPISDISVLANLTDLVRLSVSGNNLSDISALANLLNLKTLSLTNNEISDISALRNLSNLEDLYLDYNGLNEISQLANFTYLKSLGIAGNGITDISQLANFTNLTWLDLSNNCLDVSEGSATLGIVQALVNGGTAVNLLPQLDCSGDSTP